MISWRNVMINKIPESFKIANQLIKVNLLDKVADNNYGNFCDVKNEINIAKTIEVINENVQLTNEQIKNTFWHEVFHAFQFYFNNQYDETQAQIFANFMCEFIESADKPF